MRTIIGSLIILLSFSVFGYRKYRSVIFNKNVTEYLVRAADASSVEIAKRELGTALRYLEANGMTSGYTSALYETPDDDIGFWYDNLRASEEKLAAASGLNELEKNTLLIKLRETILYRGGEGREKVTRPDAIHLYPNNKLWAWGGFLAFIGLLGGMIYIVPPEEWEKHKHATTESA